MQVHILGIPMNFTPGTILIAAIITFVIFLLKQLFFSIRKFFPYKDDDVANESLFYIFMIRKDYFNDYQGFLVEGRSEFSRKLGQVANIFDINRMQEKSYRIQFQLLLNKHHAGLKESYFLFQKLRQSKVVDRQEVVKTVNRTHEILNLIIQDINEEFKDISRSAA